MRPLQAPADGLTVAWRRCNPKRPAQACTDIFPRMDLVRLEKNTVAAVEHIHRIPQRHLQIPFDHPNEFLSRVGVHQSALPAGRNELNHRLHGLVEGSGQKLAIYGGIDVQNIPLAFFYQYMDCGILFKEIAQFDAQRP